MSVPFWLTRIPCDGGARGSLRLEDEIEVRKESLIAEAPAQVKHSSTLKPLLTIRPEVV